MLKSASHERRTNTTAAPMTHKYDILFCGEYVTPFSSPSARKANLSFGFSIRNEFQDESEFQKEPLLTMAKDRIIKRLEKKGYTFYNHQFDKGCAKP
ncbi:MAG TPA: hypothetical protein VD884_13415 [Ohtaekwangia sp.]|nr:hypothetical protein [Ohtaekwangia sp.]